ncbi:MAG: tetratricopeptide repeat protein [Candidatus Obscuribacterales bacterium]
MSRQTKTATALTVLLLLGWAAPAPGASDAPAPTLDNVQDMFEKRLYDKVRGRCDAYIKKNPKEYLGYYWRGMSFYRLMQYPAALFNANKAIELETKKPEPYELRADVFIAIGQFDKALRDLSQALNKGSKNKYDIYLKRAKCFNLIGVSTDVIDNLTEALNIKKDSKTFRQRADTYYKLRKYDQAIEDYSKAMVDDPDSYEMLMRRAYCYQQVKKGPDAIKDYSRIIDKDPADWRALERRANVYFDYGDTEKALKDITDGIREFRGYKIDSLYKLRAKIYTKLGQGNLAAKDLAKIRVTKKKKKK